MKWLHISTTFHRNETISLARMVKVLLRLNCLFHSRNIEKAFHIKLLHGWYTDFPYVIKIYKPEEMNNQEHS
ncbi:hypothetical protein [Paenibacillus sp. FSL P4-0288]|uniref:hypothetical protein n=1 Tax=Paenibacillus sp. FSL P4-0288 TaxID=2921633 RepID=UPI0030F9C70D